MSPRTRDDRERSRVPSDGGQPLAVRLQHLASRVARLTPSHRDPELFHIEKDDIACELRRIARRA